MNQISEAALLLASHGWRVFPVKPGAKTPAVKGWPQVASADPPALVAMFARYGRCNIGLVTGKPSGFWVLDIDPRHGGDDSSEDLEGRYGKWPVTVRQQTPGGGFHLFFMMPEDGQGVECRAGVLPGIDVRGTRGYVVVAPSSVGGKPYRWEELCSPGEVAIAAPPAWLVDLVRRTDSSNGQGAGPRDPAQVIPRGQRNATLASLAGKLRRAGFSGLEIGAALHVANRARCAPPLDANEVDRIAGSISRYPSEASAAPQPWSDPLPLLDFPRPVFPVEVLPTWGREYVEALATATQTPVDLAGMLFLAALATASAKKIRVDIDPEWSEPVNLYVIVALPPASRKSAVLAAITKPIRGFELEVLDRARLDNARRKEAREIQERRLDAVRRRVAAADTDEDRLSLGQEAQRIAEELECTPPPRLPRYLADDVTPESLVTLLAENEGHMAVIAPEGGELFAIMAGRYSNAKANFGVFLSGHQGDPMRVDRRGRAESIDEPLLTLALTVQPDVIRGLASQPQFKQRGLVGRFLYSIPHNTLGRRSSAPDPMPPGVRETYGLRLRGLMEKSYDKAAVLRLAPEARHALRRLQDQMEPHLDPDIGELSFMADWAGKLSGQTARIAALLAMAEGADLISAGVMSRAVRLAEEYLLPHAKAAHAVMGTDEALEEARLILNAIKRKGAGHFSSHELHRWLKGQMRFYRASGLDRGLRVLTEHGHVRPVGSTEERKGPGRPPGPFYEVNPLAHLGTGTKSTKSPEPGGCGDFVDFVPADGAGDNGDLS